MWWENLLRGFWNGITAWILFIIHLFGAWKEYPIYDTTRKSGWYDFGFLVGAGSTLASSSRKGRGKSTPKIKAKA